MSWLSVIQPPVLITVLQTRPQSAQISWQPVDKVLVYQVTVKNWNSLNTTIYSNTVFGTTLDVQNISPCSSYRISVSSLNALLEPGEPRQVNYTTNSKQSSFLFLITDIYSYLIVIFDGTLDALDNGNGAQCDLSKYNIIFLVQEQNSWTQREMIGWQDP